MDKQKSPITNYPQNNIRNRAKRFAYIRNGMAGLLAKPRTIILTTFFLVAVIVAAWKVSAAFAVRLNTIPALAPVMAYTLRVSSLLIVLLLFAGFLYLLGIPRRAREIENDLAAAFGITKSSPLFYRCPFLVSTKPIKGTAAREYVFWSRWLALEKWNRPDTRKTILWALHAHSTEDFAAGKHKYTVTILAAPGVVPEEREAPQDPLFM